MRITTSGYKLPKTSWWITVGVEVPWTQGWVLCTLFKEGTVYVAVMKLSSQRSLFSCFPSLPPPCVCACSGIPSQPLPIVRSAFALLEPPEAVMFCFTLLWAPVGNKPNKGGVGSRIRLVLIFGNSFLSWKPLVPGKPTPSGKLGLLVTLKVQWTPWLSLWSSYRG